MNSPRCSTAGSARSVECVRPPVDAAPELIQLRPPYTAGSRRASASRLAPLRTRTCISGGMKRIQGGTNLVSGSRIDVGPVIAEQDEIDRGAAPFLGLAASASHAGRGRPGRLRIEGVDHGECCGPSAAALRAVEGDGLAVREGESAAASSAWANVWPRFSHWRTPRSYGSRRHSAPCTQPPRGCRADGRRGSRLDPLRFALAPLALGQRRQERLVDEHRAASGTPPPVLSLRMSIAVFAADRGVNLPDERRRHGHPRRPGGRWRPQSPRCR